MAPILSRLSSLSGGGTGGFSFGKRRIFSSGPNILFPLCANRPTSTTYMWYATQQNSNSDNFYFCNGDSHFSTGSSIKNVTTGDPSDPVGGNYSGYAAIRFGTPITVTGVNFGWRHNGNLSYCAGVGFYLFTDDIDGLGPVRNYNNPDTSNKSLGQWYDLYNPLGYIYSIGYNSGGGCNNPDTYNYPNGSFNYTNIRWAVVNTGRPGYVEDFNGTAGNGAFIITPTGNINM
jgi:hypothetical protein